MISTTNLIGVLLGVHPPKKELDRTWLANKRSVDWINGIVAKLAVPEYVKGRVDMDGADEDSAGAAAAGSGLSDEEEKSRFAQMIDELEKLAASARGASGIAVSLSV